MRGIAVLTLVCAALVLNGQTPSSTSDTIATKNLPDITVVGRNSKSDYQQMPEIVGTNIYAGKKNALIVMDNVQGNVVNNTMRQVMAKIPGIHVWESDPSGIQIGIAARGLSPNRSWEFNVRQNGYDIAADPYGYPEAYYNPQLQAVQRIEVVRGQGSLQYGPQFGGLINYILRNGSEMNKPIELETQQSFGSNGLFNSYNAIGGKKGKIHYYSFFDHREGNGWRDNSRFYNNSGYATITYQFTSKFSLTAEIMRSNMRSQQPGGLTDAQVLQDAQQSLRSRNWFDVTWTTPALIANYQINENTRWNTKLFATIGNRNSVGFMLPVTVRDTINPLTGNYNSRTVSLDQYRNYGLESRIITSYTLGKMQHNLSAGIRLYTGTTSRQADGVGTNGTGHDISISGKHPRDIVFKSNNVAAFVENIFRINEKLIIIPGIRYEWIQGSASGRNGFAANGNEILLQNITRNRDFLLAGIGAEYHITNTTEIYANYSQAYRPIQFANLQAPPTTDIVDPDLRDSKGYNLDFGYRGKIKNFLQFDISGFVLQYNNRVGVIVPNGTSNRLITNVGASTSKGIESYLEFNPARAFKAPTSFDLIVFSSYGYTDARYSGNHKDANTKGKRVENAPEHIMRAGITAGYKKWLISWQYSHVSQVFSDANNTLTPTANGNNGLIPSYDITDITLTFKMNNKFNIKSGLNNVFDARYFTRRAGGYPGPGALPGDGRTFFISLQAKL
ncbi:TonB-dependent receptor family protein [Sediminibacterium salmoneum]|uniref:TonB-dependent receptor family protein n=1 Tax=Sediminibacterium salmoneum TaxID=426421 RepID=UPI000688FEDA|nr:TonB-dependent receptor [Sediminibacterium salmoneum]